MTILGAFPSASTPPLDAKVATEPQRAVEEAELAARIDKHEKEERQKEVDRQLAARGAGWRAQETTRRDAKRGWVANVPDISREDIVAPEGRFPIDIIIRRLLDLGRLDVSAIDETREHWSAFAEARSMVNIYGGMAVQDAEQAAQLPQDREDAKVIAQRLDELIARLADFVEHVDIDDAHLFYAVGGSPPEDEEEPMKWIREETWNAIGSTRESALSLSEDLQALRDAVKPQTYGHDGRKDALARCFLAYMALSWTILTSKKPGRSGRGLFHDYCVQSWAMMGWPEQAPGYFSNRLEKGVHEELFG